MTQFGPTVTIKRSCSDCGHCRSERYAVQGDSGFSVSCSLAQRSIGDTTWVTPEWCPVLAPPAPPSGTAPAADAERGRPAVAVCLRCSRAFTEHPHAKDSRCEGFVDDPAATCLACGKRYDEHPTGGGKCPDERSPWNFQAPAAYYCENRRCTWRAYFKPCERRCPACGARVWKDHAAGHKPRPALARPAGSGDAGNEGGGR